jgi:uncharacterized membrane protein
VYRLASLQFLVLPHRGHLRAILATWFFSCQNSSGNIRPQCGQLIIFGLMYFISCQIVLREKKWKVGCGESKNWR